MKGKSFSQSVVITVGNPSSTSMISGKVLDANGNPVGAAYVSNGLPTFDANYRSAYTDSDGSYALPGLAMGAYTVTASKPGWTVSASNFNGSVTIGGPAQVVTDVNFRAAQTLYKVSGKVTYDGNLPVVGAMVSDGLGHTEPTDSAGNYTFWEPIGTYSLTASKAGLTFNAATAEVNFGNVAQNFTAQTKSVFVATLKDPPSALVAASADSGVDAGKLLKAALTESGGRGGGNGRIAQGSVPNAASLDALVAKIGSF